MGQWRLFFLKSCLNLKILSLLAPGTRGGVTGPFASHHSVNSLIRSFIHSFIPTLQGTVRAGGQPGGAGVKPGPGIAPSCLGGVLGSCTGLLGRERGLPPAPGGGGRPRGGCGTLRVLPLLGFGDGLPFSPWAAEGSVPTRMAGAPATRPASLC